MSLKAPVFPRLALLIPPPRGVTSEDLLRPVREAVTAHFSGEWLLRRSYAEIMKIDYSVIMSLGSFSLTLGKLGRREEAIVLAGQAWQKTHEIEDPSKRRFQQSLALGAKVQLAVDLRDETLLDEVEQNLSVLESKEYPDFRQEIAKAREIIKNPTSLPPEIPRDLDESQGPDKSLIRMKRLLISSMVMRLQGVMEMLSLAQQQDVVDLAERQYAETLAAADAIEDPEVSAQVQIGMASVLMTRDEWAPRANDLLRQVLKSTQKIKNPESRALAQAEQAVTFAKLGLGDRARHMASQAWRSLEEIQDATWLDTARQKLATQISEVAQILHERATQKIAVCGGFESEGFQNGVRELLLASPAYWAQRLGTLPEGEKMLEGLPPILGEIAVLGHVRGRLLFSQPRQQLRRTTLRRLHHRLAETPSQEGQRNFSILTTTLQQFEDDPSTQSLLETARHWKRHSTYQDPRFVQLVSRLLKTGNSKAFNFAMQLLGDPDFRPAGETRLRDQYRRWLLKKLCEAGHLEKDLYNKLAKIETLPRDLVDRWIQGIVRDLGVTPTVSLVYSLSDNPWMDERGIRITEPEEVIPYIQQQRGVFETQQDRFKLVKDLSTHDQKSLLYYLLFGGRTHFALIDRYGLEQFRRILKYTEREVGPVHEALLTRFGLALPSPSPKSLIDRLRAGKWPLREGKYAREIRVDISSEKVLADLEGRFQNVFSHHQLGAILCATLARAVLREEERADPEIAERLTSLEKAPGLQGLSDYVIRLQEKIPNLAERIQQKWGRSLEGKLPVSLGTLLGLEPFKINVSLQQFTLHVEKQMRGILISTIQNQKRQTRDAGIRRACEQRIGHLEKARPAEIVVLYVESLLKTNGEEVPLKHAEEWQSHLREIFEGVKVIGARGGEAKVVTLRYLDKRDDLIEILRFADAAQCCFTSANLEGQMRWLSRIWKDPLSFVFLIEDNLANAIERQAIGFVFGSLGIKGDNQPVVLLNGVYMQGKTNQAVLSILNAIESDFSRPLGATYQFVAATHGGQTQLDPAALHAVGDKTAYVNTPTDVTRYRALADRTGNPESEIYDDIAVGVNIAATTKKHVWWREL